MKKKKKSIFSKTVDQNEFYLRYIYLLVIYTIFINLLVLEKMLNIKIWIEINYQKNSSIIKLSSKY